MSLFWPPGPPKRSIVANLASKMTPKWSPKWSQSDNGRPLRNMHRHCRIAHPPPILTAFLETEKVTKKHVKKSLFKIWRQTGPTSAPPGGAVHAGEGLLFWSFLLRGALGAPFEHRAPKSHSRRSKVSPKIVEHHRKVTSKSQKNKKNASVWIPGFSRKVKTKMAGIPPCISCFFGARIFGRVWIPAPSKKQL